MKRILKTTVIIFLSIGPMVLMHSCEEKLSSPQESDSAMLATADIASVRSLTALSQEVVTITDCYLNGWERQKQQGATGTITFVNLPSPPQSGKGSLQFYCPDQKFLRLNNNQFIGTRLTTISNLSVSTFVEQSGAIADNIFIVIQIDSDADGTVNFPMVFNPIFQSGNYVAGIGPDQGAIQSKTWQTWNLLTGVWWNGNGPDPWGGGTLFTLAALINQYPNATITNQGGGPGAIRISGGAPYFTGSFTGYADNFKIGVNGVTKSYDFEETTASAGPDQTVIYGYGSNCTELNGSASGGVAPYTYSWSHGGSTPNQASTEVCPTATTTYILTVTDANGCSRSDDITVFVNDVRCGNNMDKVKVCHKGKEICIAAEAVQAHLNHGDSLGSCEGLSLHLP